MAIATSERALIEKAVAAMPACPLEELHEASPRVRDTLMSVVFDAAETLLKRRDRLVWLKMQGLEALDEYNEIQIAHGDLMFLLGVEYAREHLCK